MKLLKPVSIAAAAYLVVIVGFESMIGYFQPADASTLTLTTFDGDGTAHDRVLSRLESGGRIYVATNHWIRSWYERALQRPDVQASFDGQHRDYRAVPVDGAERERVTREHPLPAALRVLTGFPPRYLVRLDPR